MPSRSPFDAELQTNPIIDKVCEAGHFEHVAHMNVFEDQAAHFKINIMLFCATAGSDEADQSGHSEKGKQDGSQSENAKGRDGDYSSLLDVVRADLSTSESEDWSDEEEEAFKTRRSQNEHGQYRTIPVTKGRSAAKARKQKNSLPPGEDLDWQRAKEKIKEFLDFPAIASGLAFRTLKEMQNYKTRGESEKIENQPLPCTPAPVQSTRSNAIFLRESQRNLQHLIAKEQLLLEINGAVNSPPSASFQKKNETPVTSSSVKADQKSIPNTHLETNQLSNETTEHGAQLTEVPLPRTKVNVVY